MTHFFTSDTHFGHLGILTWCQRPFSSIEEMDEALIENWNKVVGRNDYVTHLGDFAWREPQKYLARLNGHVRLVLGNHDRRGPCERAGFDWVKDLFIGRVYHRPVFCFHYPCISWPSKSYKSWHLFGHVHGRRKGPPLSLDVGVDSHNYRPLAFEEVKDLIDHGTASSDADPCDLSTDSGADSSVSE